MSKIVGYTKHPGSKWPYFYLAIVVLLCLIIVLVLTNVFAQHNQQKLIAVGASVVTRQTTSIKPPIGAGAISLEQLVFSQAVDSNNQPLQIFTEIKKQLVGRVYCCSSLTVSQVPQIIRHVWLAPDGQVVAEISLELKNNQANTWSYLTLKDQASGKWQVQVKTLDDKLLGAKSFVIS